MAEQHDQPHSDAPAVPDAAAQALDRLTEGVYSLAVDGTMLYANAAALHLAQRTPDEVLGRSLWEIFPFLRTAPFGEHFTRAVSSGQVTEFEDFSPVVGSWLWRRFYPRADGVTVLTGERALPGVASEDGAELKQLLARSRTAEERYRDLLDGMAQGVVETTVTGEFVTVNQAFAVMLGYESARDLMARVTNAADLYVTPSRRRVAVASIGAGTDEPRETELRTSTGRTIWVRARTRPKHSITGTLVGLQSVVEDITEEREADRFLREHEERIAERERSRLAEAIHDDPLQMVVAAMLRLDSLQPQLPEDALEPVEQVIGLLEQAVGGLRRLILTVTPPDLSGGLGPALHALAEGIFLGTTTRVDVSGLVHVPLRVETKWQAYRILREALINARKHASARHVRISLTESPGRVELTVADDGIGGASPTSDPGHLGMATMHARAASLKGTLNVRSTPGEGTTVELRLPRDGLA